MGRVSEKKPVRVLQIGMHDQMGGIENFIMNYYRHIDKNKVMFDFIIPYKKGGYYDDEIKSIGGNIFYFSIKDDKNIFKFIKELKNFFKNNNYDIVHCNDTGMGLLYLYFAKKYNFKVRIAHSHATSQGSDLKGLIKNILKFFYVQYANVYFSCSKEAGEHMFGKKKSFKIINNAIDYSKYRFDLECRTKIRKKLLIKENEILLGHVGRFTKVKNHLFLIEIIKKLPVNYKLLLIGEGPLKSSIINKINDDNLQNRVIVLDVCHDVYKYYNAMDMFLLPSLFEGLPVVGVEVQVNGMNTLFSNTITKSIDFNDYCQFLPIDDCKIWCENIVKNSIDRKEVINDLYNIEYNAKLLEKEYTYLLRGE